MTTRKEDAGLSDDVVAAPPEGPQTSGGDPRVRAVWDAWITKLGPGTATARCIEALCIHGELNTPQLKVAGKIYQ